MKEAFIEEMYGDGDKEIYVPHWREIIQNEVVRQEKRDLEKVTDTDTFIDENEIAMKHPITGATIKLRDDGAIEMYVNEDTGFRMDPKDNAIIFFGDVFHAATKETRIHTKPHQFIWNNHNFNPYLYYGEKEGDQRYIPKIKTHVKEGEGVSERNVSIFQEQNRKGYYDNKVKDIMREIGIDFSRERG